LAYAKIFPVLTINIPESQKHSEETARNSSETSVEERISSYVENAIEAKKDVIPSLNLNNKSYYRFECCSSLKVILQLMTLAGKFEDYPLNYVFEAPRIYYDLKLLLNALKRSKMSFYERPSYSGHGFKTYTKGQEILSLLSLLRHLLNPREVGADTYDDLNELYHYLNNLYGDE
jgi:hypothetical protein